MKFLNKIIICFVAVIYLCGYKFPETLPTPTNIDTYTFNRIKFGQTSINEFAYLAPEYTKPIVEGIYTIYSESDLNKTYKSLRIGFKNQFLDWIELEFAVPQSMNKFKQLYGNPKSTNKDYSKKFNYQDYDFFNLVTDKNNVSVFGITLYAESDFNSSIAELVTKLPDYKSLNFIQTFIPGQLLETDFQQTYHGFSPNELKQEKTYKTYSVPEKYLRNNNLYTNVDLIFSNGILLFVNLIPKNLNINDVKNIYGSIAQDKILKEKYLSLDYQNFSIIYDKETNKVISIGIVGAN